MNRKHWEKEFWCLERKEGCNFSVAHCRKYGLKIIKINQISFWYFNPSFFDMYPICEKNVGYYCFKNKEKYDFFSPASQEDGGVFKMLLEQWKLACDKYD